MDYYLSDLNARRRLIEEYEKHKSLVVGFDFDDTVFDYHSQGRTYDDVIELLRRAKAVGFTLIIVTGNEDIPMIKAYCSNNNIPFDYINQNPPFIKDSRKIYCNILLDDRAGLSSAYTLLADVVSHAEVNNG